MKTFYNMFYSDKKVSGLLLIKTTLYSEKIELPIYDIDNLTNDELKNLIENFFENDDYRRRHDNFNIFNCGDHEFPYMFYFKHNTYWVHLFGEKNNFKKIIIKFLNFLKNIMIEYLHCSPYELDNDHDIVCLVGNVIKNSNMIKGVSFLGSYLKDNNLEILYKYIKNHETLKYLEFKHSPIKKLSDNCINYIDDIIKFSNIEDIDGLYENYDYFLKNLLNNFFRGGKNSNLHIRDKYMEDYLALTLSDIIKENKIDYLTEINLSSNRIKSKGFSMLIDSLLKSNNKNIIKINMNNNRLDDNCIEKLGKLIKENDNIVDIDLGNNNITNKGVEILCHYIIGNISIKSINLDYNNDISNNSFNMIKYMIDSSVISSFGIYGTEIKKEFSDKINELLKIPIQDRLIPLITKRAVKSASKM